MTRPDSTIPPLIGQSPPIQAMLDRVSALAPVDRPVLIEMAVGRMQRPAFFGPRRRLPRFAR